MTEMLPFAKHQANTADLQTCGSNLISHAAEGLTNGKLTKNAYSPALTSVTGMCSPQVESADQAVQQGSQDVTAELAWAAVVSQYWGTQVTDFNSRVDTITSTLATKKDDEGESDDPDGDSPTVQAKRDWWTAYYNYIEGGQSTVSAMLRDGPTPGHMQTAIDAGALPPMSWDFGTRDDYWNGFLGIFRPPNGDGIDQLIWGGKTASLAVLWPGFFMNTLKQTRFAPLPAPYPGFANTGWRAYLNSSNYQQRFMPRTWVTNPLKPWTKMQVPYTRWGAAARFATNKVFYPLAAVGGAYDQWSRDSQRTDLTNVEKGVRATTRGAITLAGTYAGIEGGAALGAAIGSVIPGVGTGAGAIVGGIVGGVIGSGLASELSDHAVEGVTAAWDASVDGLDTAKDWTGDRLDDAGEALEDTGGAIKDAWNSVF
ncbi:hypothetical protein [Solicola gregarius]|uniref:Uncharacterized protein n=1 Tax=Solicola gregarius TaxID=2908642 RepID=A0AA46TMP6_9ACTN|nr:hypothetical protein [Solicola gregarius]UYM07772.1 hypothetical protein L0C25_12095 [Solicola gregarius]